MVDQTFRSLVSYDDIYSLNKNISHQNVGRPTFNNHYHNHHYRQEKYETHVECSNNTRKRKRKKNCNNYINQIKSTNNLQHNLLGSSSSLTNYNNNNGFTIINMNIMVPDSSNTDTEFSNDNNVTTIDNDNNNTNTTHDSNLSSKVNSKEGKFVKPNTQTTEKEQSSLVSLKNKEKNLGNIIQIVNKNDALFKENSIGSFHGIKDNGKNKQVQDKSIVKKPKRKRRKNQNNKKNAQLPDNSPENIVEMKNDPENDDNTANQEIQEEHSMMTNYSSLNDLSGNSIPNENYDDEYQISYPYSNYVSFPMENNSYFMDYNQMNPMLTLTVEQQQAIFARQQQYYQYYYQQQLQDQLQQHSIEQTKCKTYNTKTIACKFYRSSSCHKGSSCPFSHDLKLEACVFYHWKKSGCEKGESCPFSHDPMNMDQFMRLNQEYSKYKKKFEETALETGMLKSSSAESLDTYNSNTCNFKIEMDQSNIKEDVILTFNGNGNEFGLKKVQIHSNDVDVVQNNGQGVIEGHRQHVTSKKHEVVIDLSSRLESSSNDKPKKIEDIKVYTDLNSINDHEEESSMVSPKKEPKFESTADVQKDKDSSSNSSETKVLTFTDLLQF